MPSKAPSESATGFAYGVGAYALWGFAPAFWHLVDTAPAVELLAHRVAWGCVFFVLVVLVRGQGRTLLAVRKQTTVLLRLAGAAALLCVNWFLFVYAVLTDRVLDVSLGYFINPLVSIALGRLALGEQLRPGQTVAVAIAAVGIAVSAVAAGGLPWISLALAGAFALYGLIRKTTVVQPLVGSTAEAMLVMPFAATYLVWLAAHGAGTWQTPQTSTQLLLLCTGPVTAIPLLLFVNAAQRLRLSTLGILQYLAPTLQFVLGIAVFGEDIDAGRIIAFAIVWVALVVYSLSSTTKDL